MLSSQNVKHFKYRVKASQPWTPVRLLKTTKSVFFCRHEQMMDLKTTTKTTTT